MKMNNVFKFIIIMIFLCFIFILIASRNGYYEYKLGSKRNLTDKAIERFEEDVKEGKYIDINNYIESKSVNYNNKISEIGNDISNTITSVISKGFSYFFDYLNKQAKK